MDEPEFYDEPTDSVDEPGMFNIDPIKVADLIQDKIAEIRIARLLIKEYATRKSTSAAKYSKQIAIVTLQLKNNQIEQFEGEIIPPNPAVTLIKTLAEGICWEAELEKEEGENQYKGLIAILDAIKAELNGLQSVNRHLDNLK